MYVVARCVGLFFWMVVDVPQITAYLFHAGGHEDPAKLKANEDKSL